MLTIRDAGCPALAVGRSVPPAAGPCSSSRPCSSLRSAWRTSWPVCSFHPSPLAAHHCTCSSLLSAYCTLQNRFLNSMSVFTRTKISSLAIKKQMLPVSLFFREMSPGAATNTVFKFDIIFKKNKKKTHTFNREISMFTLLEGLKLLIGET